jgi:hypothetical protein
MAVRGRSMTYVALVLAAALIGCGDGSAQDSSTTTTHTTTSTPPASCTSDLSADPAPASDEIFIEIAAPRDDQVFDDRSVRFEGITQPGATVMAGQFQDVSEDGTWCFDLLLGPEPGPLTARFTAVDESGNEATDTVQVFYQPPVVTTTSEPSL